MAPTLTFLLLLTVLAPAAAARGSDAVTASSSKELADALTAGAAWIEVAGVVPLLGPSTLQLDVLVTAAAPGAALDLGHGGGGSLLVG